MRSLAAIEDPCSLYSGDVYIFIKIKPTKTGGSPFVYVWQGAHTSCAPLLAWTRTLKNETIAKYGKFECYQEMRQGAETPEFLALFPAFFVIYEGRLAHSFSLSAGTLKHQRGKSKRFGHNIFLVLRLKMLARRWIARARAALARKVPVVKGIGFRGKRAIDFFEVNACSMSYVSVSQVM
jgi:hypothetical protein